ncbi:MAG: bifunctional demethylmenaquinone methyltransferase/2-methoxy-6-polyprenyl-1,4-benzoquinol methylase UbiE [Mucinivorans sp.]
MGDKKEHVRDMFNSIAQSYDLLNHTLSFSFDRRWRRKVIALVRKDGAQRVLDVATGTGDMAIELVRSGVKNVVGVDLSQAMVAVGRKKITARGLDAQIELQEQDVEQLTFPDNHFSAVTCSFGARNFEHLDRGLSQMQRVIAPEAGCYVLEFSTPQRGLWGAMYGFYFHHVLPLIGRMVSGNKKAYTYLPNSVDGFLSGEAFLDRMRAAGFQRCSLHSLMGGIATIYIGYKIKQ